MQILQKDEADPKTASTTATIPTSWKFPNTTVEHDPKMTSL
jgi:hypothetical protein